MFRILTNARTVWVDTLKTEQKVGADQKPYTAKSILFRVASKRNYSVPKKDEQGNIVVDAQGQPIKERPTDFVLCKATGGVAQVIADYCSGKQNTNGVDKIVSRYLELSGHLETYKTTKKVPVEKVVTINNQNYKVNFEVDVEVDSTILMVDSIDDFLDARPAGNTSQATADSASQTAVTVTPIEGEMTTGATVTLGADARVIDGAVGEYSAPPVLPGEDAPPF